MERRALASGAVLSPSLRLPLVCKTKAAPRVHDPYGVDPLVYFEHSNNIHDAIAREKQIKGRTRAKKVALIESMNPGWNDLAADWYATLGELGPPKKS
jgi:hypothetical protein